MYKIERILDLFFYNFFEFDPFALNAGYIRYPQSDPYRRTLAIASIREVLCSL